MRQRLGIAGVIVACWAHAPHANAYKVDRETGTVTVTSLADFDKCADGAYDGEPCLNALKAYVDKQPKEAFGAGKHARLHFRHWTALPFFAKALEKAVSAEQCQDEDTGMAVVSGLELPSDDAHVALARKIAEQCWTQLQAKLTSELADGGAIYKSNVCPLLASKQLAAPQCAPAKL